MATNFLWVRRLALETILRKEWKHSGWSQQSAREPKLVLQVELLMALLLGQ
jgi:hypothetical protein